MSQDTSPEQRRYRRVTAAVRVVAETNEFNFPEDVRDLSVDGFSVATDKPLPAGSEAVFKLVIPQRGPPLSIIGRVVWSRREGEDRGMGVHITRSGPTERQWLESYVARLIRD